MGAIFRVPFFYYKSTKDLIDFLHEKKITVFAAALDGAVDYASASYGMRAAVVIGNEGNGLLPETVQSADAAVKIPMDGSVESLNASVSAALFLYEIRRHQCGEA